MTRIQERGGINLYSFVGNNPLRWVDSFGLQAETGFDESGNVVWWGPWDQTPPGMQFQQTPYNGDTIPNDFLGGPGATPSGADFLPFILPEIPVVNKALGWLGEKLGLKTPKPTAKCPVKQPTYLYQKVSATGEHLKFGVTKNPITRYTQSELAGGQLNIIAQGTQDDMLQLERSLHSTLPIGPEEGQTFYIQQQIDQGLQPPPY